MTRNFILVPVLAVAMAGCATRADERAALHGALIGAAGGAVLSAANGGDPLEGAAIGAAGGAAVGVITQDGKQRRVYRHNDGRNYWVDNEGRRRFISNDRR